MARRHDRRDPALATRRASRGLNPKMLAQEGARTSRSRIGRKRSRPLGRDGYPWPEWIQPAAPRLGDGEGAANRDVPRAHGAGGGTGDDRTTVTFQRIVCAIDYSPSAIKALQYGLELGRQAHGCVTVLYVLVYLDPEEPCEHVDFDIRRRRHHFINHAQERLHTLLTQETTGLCEIKETVAIDRVDKAILQHAVASQADLIVMGAQGTAGLQAERSRLEHAARRPGGDLPSAHGACVSTQRSDDCSSPLSSHTKRQTSRPLTPQYDMS